MANQVKRNLHPGEEWLYVKAYCGTRIADKILLLFNKTVFLPLEQEKIADQWFFVRYIDNDFHVRMRIHLTKKDFNRFFALFNAYAEPLLESGAVHEFSFHTYRRELERYGAERMDLVETLFRHDSRFVIEVIKLLHGDPGENHRWMTALLLVDAYFEQFGFSKKKRMDFSRMMMESMYAKLNVDKQLKLQIDQKYRATLPIIYPLLLGDRSQIGFSKAIEDILSQWCQYTSSTFESLLYSPGFSDDIAFSLIHMAMNKLFRARPNEQEAVIYTYLYKYYRSALIRSDQQQKQQEEVRRLN